MSYRVEVASSGRAGCQSTDCKKSATKISKNELRLGTWVDIPDRGGSWRWRHWGCVTGKIILNIRQALDETRTGKYNWEALDGYEGEDDKNSLHHHPKLQDKVRRVISQGFIDPGDFNGDPEMNKLGSSGLRIPASKKKKIENQEENPPDRIELRKKLDNLEAERKSILADGESPSKIDIQLKIVQDALQESERANPMGNKLKSSKKKPGRKRGRALDESDGEDNGDPEEESEKPVKKKRISAKDKCNGSKIEETKPELKALGKKKIKKEEVKAIQSEKKTALDKKKASSKSKAMRENSNEDEDEEDEEEEEKNIKVQKIPKPVQRKNDGIKKESTKEKNTSSNTGSRKNQSVGKKRVKREEKYENHQEENVTSEPKKVPVKKAQMRNKVKTKQQIESNREDSAALCDETSTSEDD